MEKYRLRAEISINLMSEIRVDSNILIGWDLLSNLTNSRQINESGPSNKYSLNICEKTGHGS